MRGSLVKTSMSMFRNSFRVRGTQYLDGILRGEYCKDLNECAIGKCIGNNKICINTIRSD
jgi:hypothetical protein